MPAGEPPNYYANLTNGASSFTNHWEPRNTRTVYSAELAADMQRVHGISVEINPYLAADDAVMLNTINPGDPIGINRDGYAVRLNPDSYTPEITPIGTATYTNSTGTVAVDPYRYMGGVPGVDPNITGTAVVNPNSYVTSTAYSTQTATNNGSIWSTGNFSDPSIYNVGGFSGNLYTPSLQAGISSQGSVLTVPSDGENLFEIRNREGEVVARLDQSGVFHVKEIKRIENGISLMKVAIKETEEQIKYEYKSSPYMDLEEEI